MKDLHHSNVNGPDVESTDAPVITSDIATAGVVHAESMLGMIVEAAFDDHAPQLKAFALAAVRDGDAADDLVQETFLRFVRTVRREGCPTTSPVGSTAFVQTSSSAGAAD